VVPIRLNAGGHAPARERQLHPSRPTIRRSIDGPFGCLSRRSRGFLQTAAVDPEPTFITAPAAGGDGEKGDVCTELLHMLTSACAARCNFPSSAAVLNCEDGLRANTHLLLR